MKPQDLPPSGVRWLRQDDEDVMLVIVAARRAEVDVEAEQASASCAR